MAMKVFNVGDVLAAADVNEYLVNTLYADKPSDTSRASTTTIANDPDLTLPVGASKKYELDMQVVYTAVNSTGDLKFVFTVPASAVFTGSLFGVAIGSSALAFPPYQASGLLITGPAQTVAGGGIAQNALRVSGILAVAGTSGSITFQWAQGTSNATPTVVKQGSYMRLRRVS